MPKSTSRQLKPTADLAKVLLPKTSDDDGPSVPNKLKKFKLVLESKVHGSRTPPSEGFNSTLSDVTIVREERKLICNGRYTPCKQDASCLTWRANVRPRSSLPVGLRGLMRRYVRPGEFYEATRLGRHPKDDEERRLSPERFVNRKIERGRSAMRRPVNGRTTPPNLYVLPPFSFDATTPHSRSAILVLTER
jgi:hypothetical protein